VNNTDNAITICLYVAIPEKEESRKEIRPWPRRLRSLTKYSLDRVATRLSRRLHLNIHHYETALGIRGNSNRGDIAIRLAIRQQLTKAFAPRPVRFLEVKWGELTDYAAAEVNACCDIFVIGGGGYIFLNADGSVGHMLESVEELGKIRCPVFAYGIGLNRLMHEQICGLDGLPDGVRDKIRYLGERCELISVRDHATARLFELYSDKQVALTGDPVLSFVSGGKASVLRAATSPTIGINLAAHGWRTLSVLKPLLPAVIGFLRDIQRKHLAELVYFQHHDLERPVIDFLRARGIKLNIVSGTPNDLLDGYAKADFVICQMLHASIFAATAGTPFLNIAYDDKNLAFGKLLGVPECCLSHRDVSPAVLERKFASLFQDRSLLRDRLESRKRELQSSQLRFADLVAAEALRLAGRRNVPAQDDQMGDHLSESDVSAIMQQIRNAGASLH
jgi:polysaccharide pyruvyl transferase WcaK-like protein